MLLYNSRVSGNCYKVRLLFAHLGIAYELRELDVLDRSDRREVLGELNPALASRRSCSTTAARSPSPNAIIFHFAEGTQYLPEDSFERAQVLQWLFFEQYSHEPNIAVARFWALFDVSPPSTADYEHKMKAGRAALQAMDAHLTDRPYSSASATRSPTSRSTRTPTWRPRAGSSSALPRDQGLDAEGSWASPATCRSRRERGPDGRRAGDPHAAHPQGVRARAGPARAARRAVRARPLGAQPPPHQPLALPGPRTGVAGSAQAGRRPRGGRQARPRADAGGGDGASAPTTRSRTRRTCWRPRAPPTRCCWRRTRAAWPATGARLACCAATPGWRPWGSGRDERFVALIHLGRPRQNKEAPERAPVAEIVEYLG